VSVEGPDEEPPAGHGPWVKVDAVGGDAVQELLGLVGRVVRLPEEVLEVVVERSEVPRHVGAHVPVTGVEA
jgi:hypothetical protein